MGASIRIFYLNKENFFIPVPFAKYERFLKGKEKFPDCGKEIKFSALFIKLENKKPVHVAGAQHLIITVDSKGYINKKVWWEGAGLIMDNSAKAIRKYFEKFAWQPDDNNIRALLRWHIKLDQQAGLIPDTFLLHLYCVFGMKHVVLSGISGGYIP